MFPDKNFNYMLKVYVNCLFTLKLYLKILLINKNVQRKEETISRIPSGSLVLRIFFLVTSEISN